MGSLVKVFGERNTGTRAIIRMLRARGDVRLRATPVVRRAPEPGLEAAITSHFHGPWRQLYLAALAHDQDPHITPQEPWKHAAPTLSPALIAAGALTLFAVRDPYSWALSMARRPYHIRGPRPASFEAFLTRPWLSAAREGVAPVLASPLHLYCAKLRAYLAYAQAAAHQDLAATVLQFEHFVPDPVGSLGHALAELGLSPRPLSPVPTTKRSDDLPSLQAFHRDQTWRAYLTRADVQAITERVDWTVARRFGYAPLDPMAFPEGLTDTARTARNAYFAQGRAGARLAA